MHIRWGDDDRYFGPFTYARDTHGYRPIAIVLGSGDGDDYPGCRLRMSAFGHTLIVALPPIIKPWRRRVDTPRGGYWDSGEREYGFSLSEGHLSVKLGRVTNDSRTEQTWGCFLPWTQWRFVRHSLYGLDGSLFADLPVHARWGTPECEEEERLRSACPTVAFEFDDFDGERITAVTKIEERAWKFGTGWFKWLSVFRQQKIRRSLDLRFSSEVGARKGSWKGGTIGHGINMLPGELHEAAFRRY
ncbi:MAG TPA: hypothetical protein VFJ10_14930, partial [Acidobacteriaceae bacterium]|nr:hypothetical protein [Acidobacteriaceae bacterium]